MQNGVSRAGDPAVDQEMKEKAGILVDTLKSFGVTVRITGIFRGPSVTRYEIQPAAGIKVSKITGLADDIALSLAAQGVRIEAPIPGKPAIGIEVPNSHKDTVSLREILESELPQFQEQAGVCRWAGYCRQRRHRRHCTAAPYDHRRSHRFR